MRLSVVYEVVKRVDHNGSINLQAIISTKIHSDLYVRRLTGGTGVSKDKVWIQGMKGPFRNPLAFPGLIEVSGDSLVPRLLTRKFREITETLEGSNPCVPNIEQDQSPTSNSKGDRRYC